MLRRPYLLNTPVMLFHKAAAWLPHSEGNRTSPTTHPWTAQAMLAPSPPANPRFAAPRIDS